MEKRGRKRNYNREAALETIRYVDHVQRGMYEIVGEEIKDDQDKERLIHFRRGMNFVLRVLREKL